MILSTILLLYNNFLFIYKVIKSIYNNFQEVHYMAIKYYKLFDFINRRGLKKTDLISMAGITSTTLARLSKNQTVNIEIIDRICSALNCQPGDLLEYVEDKKGNP